MASIIVATERRKNSDKQEPDTKLLMAENSVEVDFQRANALGMLGDLGCCIKMTKNLPEVIQIIKSDYQPRTITYAEKLI